MKIKIIIILYLSSTIINSYAQNQEEDNIFREAVKTLASDEFGGRKPLTEHEELTVNYIADEFNKLGLMPANGNSYFQQVPLLNVKTRTKNNELTIKGEKNKITLKEYDDYVVWSTRGEKKMNLTNKEFVFVGFGINAPEYDWNDYEGIDVKDKIVIALVNDPGFYDAQLFNGDNMTYYGRWIYKFEEASRQGAAGILVVHDTKPASYAWNVVQASWGHVNLSLFSENKNRELVAIQGWLGNDAANKLFHLANTSYEEALDVAKKKGFKAYPLHVKSNIELISDVKIASSSNVAAIFPGTDLKDEYIIYSAHWDHLGIGEAIDGDSIYNGAIDNATGVAALFVLADRFKKLKNTPRRSVLFLSITAEEAVLLGSEYYAKHPLVPLEQTVINLNMDGYGPRARTSDIKVLGLGYSDTDKYVYETAAAQGRIVKPIINKTGSYFRSDHFNFVKVGVPVVFAQGGDDLLDPKETKFDYTELRKRYHRPTDEYNADWDLSGTFDDINILYGIGYRLANENYFPQWNDGIVYKTIREKK